MKFNTKTIFWLFFAGMLAVLSPRPAAAQSSVTWNEPVNLSQTLTGSVHPAIVADFQGNVHVFWSEDVNGPTVQQDEIAGPANTIMYKRWDGKQWSEAVEILAVPDDKLADYVNAAIDHSGRIHLVWTGITNLYYSTALLSDAASVHAWSKPEIITSESARTRYEASIAVDSRDNVHVVYAAKGSAPGIFHMMLAPNNAYWSSPIRVSNYLQENEAAFSELRFIIDDENRLHAVWSAVSISGFNQAVYYTGSEAFGETWYPPIQLGNIAASEGFMGFPSIMSPEKDKLLVIYGNDTNKFRRERISNDAGRTWSDAHLILLEMEGVNGFLIPLMDNAKNLHLIINMRPSANQVTGIYYAPRNGEDWSPITPVAVNPPSAPTAHYTDAVIRLGNEIHVVWTQLRGGEIWYVKGIINNVDPTSPEKLTPPALQATTVVQASPPTNSVSTSLSTTTPAVAAELLIREMDTTPPPTTTSPAKAILISTIFVVVMLVIVIINQIRKNK